MKTYFDKKFEILFKNGTSLIITAGGVNNMEYPKVEFFMYLKEMVGEYPKYTPTEPIAVFNFENIVGYRQLEK